MTRKNNKKCILCGKIYSYCSRCSEYDDLPRWMEIYCGSNCRAIFNTLTEYCCKSIDATEAAKKLEECDLSDFEKYHEQNKNLINEIKNGGIKAEEKDITSADESKEEVNDEAVSVTTTNNYKDTINNSSQSTNNYNNKQNRVKYNKHK